METSEPEEISLVTDEGSMRAMSSIPTLYSKYGMRRFIDIVALLEDANPAAAVREEMIALAAEWGIVADLAWFDDHELSLENLNTPANKRRQGLARAFMQILCKRADDHQLTIWVHPAPYEGNIDTVALRTFYARFGFGVDPEMSDEDMVRRPKFQNRRGGNL